MSAWTCRSSDGKAGQKIVPPRPRIPYWKGLGADSEEKHEPVSDIDAVVVDSLKALDPEWPIREADIDRQPLHVRFGPIVLQKSKVAGLRIFRENTKREAIADSVNLNRVTEVACEFNVRR